MLRSWCGGLLILTVTGALAAGGAASHEAVVKELLTTLDGLTTTLRGVKDADTAKAARPELKKAAAAWAAVRKKAEALPPPEPAIKDRLMKEYRPKLDAAVKGLFGQVRRVEDVPGGPAALREIAGVLDQGAP